MSEKEFTKDEIKILKIMAQETMRFNEIYCDHKFGPKPNVFPKGYTGPRSFAEAMSPEWQEKSSWIYRKIRESK